KVPGGISTNSRYTPSASFTRFSTGSPRYSAHASWAAFTPAAVVAPLNGFGTNRAGTRATRKPRVGLSSPGLWLERNADRPTRPPPPQPPPRLTHSPRLAEAPVGSVTLRVG